MKRTNKDQNKRIARERIVILFEEASKNKTKAQRYVELARKLAMKYKVRMPNGLNKKYCKHCYSYFNSENSRVRIRNGKRTVYCNSCKKFNRYLIKK